MENYNYSVAIVPLEPGNGENLNQAIRGGKIIHVEKVGLRQVRLGVETKMAEHYKVLVEYTVN